MKFTDKIIGLLAGIITGDSQQSPYRTGPKLVEFFNQFFKDKDTYEQGFPTRWYYARDKLKLVNGTEKLEEIIKAAFDPRTFLDTKFSVETAASFLNKYLEFEDFKLVRVGKFYQLESLGVGTVAAQSLENIELTSESIQRNLQKAERKLSERDYEGAITNARSLIETVLIEIEKELNTDAPSFNGDLVKLFNRTQKLLDLDTGRKDISEVVRQMSSGLASVVSGLSGLRNKASDAHGSDFSPGIHHARLAVNAAKTICDFVIDEYNIKKG